MSDSIQALNATANVAVNTERWKVGLLIRLGIAMTVAGLVMTLGITRPQQGALTLVPENVYAVAWLFIYTPTLVYLLTRPER